MQHITDTSVLNHVARYGNRQMTDAAAVAMLRDRFVTERARLTLGLIFLTIVAAFIYSTPFTHADIQAFLPRLVIGTCIAAVIVAYMVARTLRAYIMHRRAINSIAASAVSERHLSPVAR